MMSYKQVLTIQYYPHFLKLFLPMACLEQEPFLSIALFVPFASSSSSITNCGRSPRSVVSLSPFLILCSSPKAHPQHSLFIIYVHMAPKLASPAPPSLLNSRSIRCTVYLTFPLGNFNVYNFSIPLPFPHPPLKYLVSLTSVFCLKWCHCPRGRPSKILEIILDSSPFTHLHS